MLANDFHRFCRPSETGSPITRTATGTVMRLRLQGADDD